MDRRRTLLIPALLDRHWPLLQWAFASPAFEPVVLEERGVEDLGLRHVHGDLCYPFVLITGQVLAALRSGRYDPARTAVLISQAGDGCRGSCLIRLLRPVLDRAGFSRVELCSLNLRGQDRSAALPVSVAMARRALAAAFWGDALLLLRNQVRPREARPGETEALWRAWTLRLSEELAADRALSAAAMLRRCDEIARSFQQVETVPRAVQKVALVGDLYTKYCGLGNWELPAFLEARGCQVGVNGLSWYALYYLDTHSEGLLRLGGQPLQIRLERLQRRMLDVLRRAGFETPPPYGALKALAAELGAPACPLGSGWLLSAEAAAWVRMGHRKVLAALPFACLPGHIYGRGQYAALQRKLPGSLIVGLDYDAGLRPGTVESRVRLLLDTRLEESPTPPLSPGHAP